MLVDCSCRPSLWLGYSSVSTHGLRLFLFLLFLLILLHNPLPNNCATHLRPLQRFHICVMQLLTICTDDIYHECLQWWEVQCFPARCNYPDTRLIYVRLGRHDSLLSAPPTVSLLTTSACISGSVPVGP